MKKIFTALTFLCLLAVSLTAQETSHHRDVILFENNGFIFASYMRVGLHVNSNGSMVEGGGKWNVAGGYNGMRFMNEANYSEWLLGYESPRDDSSWWGGAYFRVAYDIPDFSKAWLDISNHSVVLPEALFRLGFAHTKWNFWIGRRYNYNIGIGMMDYYVANIDGNGVGMEGIALGEEATLDVNWLFSYSNGHPNGTTADFLDVTKNLDTYPGKQTLAFVFKGEFSWNDNYSLIIAPSIQGPGTTPWDTNGDGEITVADGEKSHLFGGGAFLGATYDMNSFFGMDGSNQFYASGGFGTGAQLKADTDLSAFSPSDWSMLVGMQGSAYLTDSISFKTNIHYEHRSFAGNTDWIAFGLRPMFKVGRIFALQFEYDLETAVTDKTMVNRITFAPTFLPPGGNVDSNLQIMPYVTYAYGHFDGGDAVTITGMHGMAFGVFGHVGF